MTKNKVLAYHSIGACVNKEPGAELYCVSENAFRRQMELLLNTPALPAGRQYSILTTKITFDDGLLDNYTTAYPILKELGMSAYFFILVGKIGRAGYMNWRQIRELKDAGMTIGSHGMTHRILTGLSDKDLRYEFKGSKKIIENKLGRAIDCLSVPRGFDNKKILDKAREAGYKTIFTSHNRIAVKAGWDLEKFASVLNNGYSAKDKLVGFVKESSKRVLGAKNYDRMRTAILK